MVIGGVEMMVMSVITIGVLKWKRVRKKEGRCIEAWMNQVGKEMAEKETDTYEAVWKTRRWQGRKGYRKEG